MSLFRTLAVAVALFAVAGCSSEPRGLSGASTPAAASLTAADRNFIAQAAYGGWGEIALGRLAQQQGSSQAVRDFGRQMVADHTQANQELASLASARGISPPTAPDPGRQAVASALESASGSNFDRQYVQQQIADHEVSMVLFQNAANTSQDPQLRAFAQKYAPIIQRHYSMLRSMTGQSMSSR
jgi:putative membrane protein